MLLVSTNNYVAIFLVIYSLTDLANAQSDVIINIDLYVQNLNAQCMRCLCHAVSNCNITLGCNEDYCGPFKITHRYWEDAGRMVMPEDDPDRDPAAYEDCALHFRCAQQLVVNYMAKFGQDCNGDGVTDCDDYSMIHYNGGYNCTPPLTMSEAGRDWTNRYKKCLPGKT